MKAVTETQNSEEKTWFWAVVAVAILTHEQVFVLMNVLMNANTRMRRREGGSESGVYEIVGAYSREELNDSDKSSLSLATCMTSPS